MSYLNQDLLSKMDCSGKVLNVCICMSEGALCNDFAFLSGIILPIQSEELFYKPTKKLLGLREDLCSDRVLVAGSLDKARQYLASEKIGLVIVDTSTDDYGYGIGFGENLVDIVDSKIPVSVVTIDNKYTTRLKFLNRGSIVSIDYLPMRRNIKKVLEKYLEPVLTDSSLINMVLSADSHESREATLDRFLK